MMHSGIWMFSMGMSSCNSSKLFTYFILLLNLVLQQERAQTENTGLSAMTGHTAGCSRGGGQQRRSPDEGLGDGQDGPDEPRRVENNEGFQILPEPGDRDSVTFHSRCLSLEILVSRPLPVKFPATCSTTPVCNSNHLAVTRSSIQRLHPPKLMFGGWSR